MFERYTESARRALFFARYEVCQLGARKIETEHLLLGVSRAAKGIVARVLENADLSTGTLRREIAGRTVTRGRMSVAVEIPFSESTKRTLQFAVDEADRLGHHYIGVEHVLLGILREDDALAASLLTSHGVKLGDVRTAIETMPAGPPDVEGPPPAEISTRAAYEIDQLKASIDALAAVSADSREAHAIRKSIRARLEDLKQFFRS